MNINPGYVQCITCGSYDLVVTKRRTLFTYSILAMISGATIYYFIAGYLPGNPPMGYPLPGENYIFFYLWLIIMGVAIMLSSIGVVYFIRAVMLSAVVYYCRNCKRIWREEK